MDTTETVRPMVTRSVSLDRLDSAALDALAERYDGGNASRLVRRLIREAGNRDSERGITGNDVPAVPVLMGVGS